MTETYRTDNARARADARAAFSQATGRHDQLGQRDRYETYADDRASLVAENSAILLGILLGGTAGHLVASSIRRSDRSAHEVSGIWDRMGADRSAGQKGWASSVEMDETTEMIASNKVEGTKVYNHAGEHLGEVYNFMVGKRSGRVAYAVMSFGAFLGIGQRYHALPWNVLMYETSKGGYIISTTKDQLMSAPHFAAGEEPFARTEDMRHIREFWSSGTI